MIFNAWGLPAALVEIAESSFVLCFGILIDAHAGEDLESDCGDCLFDLGEEVEEQG